MKIFYVLSIVLCIGDVVMNRFDECLFLNSLFFGEKRWIIYKYISKWIDIINLESDIGYGRN